MAKVSVNSLNFAKIELSLRSDFIKKYNLESILNYSYLLQYSVDLNSTKSISFPFNFPPHERQYDLVFLNQFIKLFNSLLNQYHIEQIHSDELLFLAYTFIIEDRQKQIEIYKENYLRSNGKLLLDFIKVPLTKHNISNIRNAFSDDGLFPDEIDDHLLAYLGVVSGQHEDTFKRLVQSKLKESPDLIWEIMDLNELDESLKTKLIRKIQIDKNISIEMPNGNLLIISKDITPKFKQKGKYKNFNFSAISSYQSKMIISSIVNSLFDEQKGEGTQFYDKLLKHDFESTNYKDLDKAVGLLTSDYHTYKLKKLHSLLIRYFTDNNIMTVANEGDTKRIRNNFIIQYFIMLGLFLNSKDKLEPYTSMSQLENSLSKFQDKKRGKPSYANTVFHDTFKNLNR